MFAVVEVSVFVPVVVESKVHFVAVVDFVVVNVFVVNLVVPLVAYFVVVAIQYSKNLDRNPKYSDLHYVDDDDDDL